MRWTPLILAVGCSSGHSSEPGPSNTALPAATTPADGVMLAVRARMRGLDVVRVAPDRVEPLGSIENVFAFGWLDRETLVTYDNNLPRDHAGAGAFFQRVVGAKVVDRFELPTQGMGPGSLVITGSHEAWFAECVPTACTSGDEFLRLWPAPRIKHTGPPDGVIPRRATTGFADVPDTALPTAKEPSGVELSRVKVPIDRGKSSFEVDGVACEAKGKRITVPDSSWDGVDPSFRVESTRWVSTEPPFFEVVLSMPDLDTGRRQIAFPYRACETTTHQVQSLGGTLWAEHVVSEGIEDGTWAFWNGATRVGSVAGASGLRVAR